MKSRLSAGTLSLGLLLASAVALPAQGVTAFDQLMSCRSGSLAFTVFGSPGQSDVTVLESDSSKPNEIPVFSEATLGANELILPSYRPMSIVPLSQCHLPENRGARENTLARNLEVVEMFMRIYFFPTDLTPDTFDTPEKFLQLVHACEIIPSTTNLLCTFSTTTSGTGTTSDPTLCLRVEFPQTYFEVWPECH